MRPLRIVLLAVGSLLALVSVGLLAAGGALVGIHATQRDDDGWYRAGPESFRTSTYALTSQEIDLHLDLEDGDLGFLEDIGRARVDARRDDGGDVFVGIGPSPTVDRYLAASAHDEVVDVTGSGAPRYRRADGELQPPPPAIQPFWVAAASGPGEQRLDWDVSEGAWTVVVMNADASRGVAVRTAVGVRIGILLPIGLGLLGGAVVFGVLAATALILGLRRDAGASASSTAVPEIVTDAYPVRLRGELDDPLSRWLWLVKWFLAIPHLLVLALLWPAAVVLTFVAGVSVLVTGRYPPGVFDFNVGVLRWTWRVTFYAFTFGTDRYPPFRLAPDPSYPADLEVDRPAQLSRGLVLVKWWLLALPHYVLLAIFGGGITWWAWGWGSDGDGRSIGGAGLLGVLALIAGIALLVTRRYPQPLFDLVVGLQRWTYRVLAYAALMRDEYPPFRLDQGGIDPGSLPPAPEGVLADAA